MKFLLTNEFQDATLSASNESLNYPVLNLLHPFLNKRFQTFSTVSTITAEFTADKCFDCFFWGFYRSDSLEVRFYDVGASLLLTLNPSLIYSTDAVHFTQLTTVRKVEIDIASTTAPLYLGGISGGCCVTLEDPLAAYIPSNPDNSIITESPSGQTNFSKINPMRQFDFGFRNLSQSEKDAILSELLAVGRGFSFFIDFYEENHAKESPMYGKYMNNISTPYDPIKYAFELQLRESK